MKLFLGIAVCCLLPGIAVSQRGGSHGGRSGGFRGGPGGFRGGFGSLRNRSGPLGFNSPYGFGYPGAGILGYGDVGGGSESYSPPAYISIAGPYIGTAAPYIGAADNAYGPWPAGVDNPSWYPAEPIAREAPPYEASWPSPLPNLRFDQAFDRPAQSIDETESRVLVWIAFKDHLVDTAVAYWVEQKDLHYIKTDGSQHQVPLQLVDRQTSARLNAKGPGKLVLP